MTIKHSFAAIAGSDTRLLVLGSLPGERSLIERRYYAHPQNQFWQLMSGVIGRDLPALSYDERLEALAAARIGLWDVIAHGLRSGSSDAAIRDPVSNDLIELIDTLPALRAIGFNGATAHRHGIRQLGALSRPIALIPLPSSSALHTVGLAAKRPAWEVLRRYVS